MKKHVAAIVLAAGQGKRMKTTTRKQFLTLAGKPLIYYSLQAFEQAEFVDSVILVTNVDELAYVQNEIVAAYGFRKVTAVVPGGSERFESVWRGLQQLRQQSAELSGYVFIHDGARPLLSPGVLDRVYREVQEYRACVVGVPAKDTIKIADAAGIIQSTPDRRQVWVIQTPQVFALDLVYEAYRRLMAAGITTVTDDAMVVERMLELPVKITRGDYENIKITTKEDLEIAALFLKNKGE